MTTFNISHHFYNVNSTRAGNVLVLIIAVSSFIHSKYICGIFAICQELCTWYALVKIVWKKDISVERRESSLTHTVRVLLYSFNSQLSCFDCLGAHRPARAFPSCGERGCSPRQRSGFSLRRLLLFGSTGPGRVGFSLRAVQALGQGLRSCGARLQCSVAAELSRTGG